MKTKWLQIFSNHNNFDYIIKQSHCVKRSSYMLHARPVSSEIEKTNLSNTVYQSALHL